MHRIRVSLIILTMAAVGLAWPAAAVAQPAPTEPASFVGWVLDETHIDSGTTEDTGTVLERRDLAYSYDFETSDPRITGMGIWNANGDRYQADPLFELQTSTWVITVDGGTWEGVGSGLRGTGVGDSMTALLQGTGDYEGMSAYIVIEWSLAGGTLRGAIFPDSVPAAPAS